MQLHMRRYCCFRILKTLFVFGKLAIIVISIIHGHSIHIFLFHLFFYLILVFSILELLSLEFMLVVHFILPNSAFLILELCCLNSMVLVSLWYWILHSLFWNYVASILCSLFFYSMWIHFALNLWSLTIYVL